MWICKGHSMWFLENLHVHQGFFKNIHLGFLIGIFKGHSVEFLMNF